MMNNVAASGLIAALGTVLAGCGSESGEDSTARMRELQESPGGSAAPGDAPVAAASLAWDVPEGWSSREPSGEMRAAELSVPGEAGVAELIFFHFGPGQGGDVEANLARWARAVLDESGEPVQPAIDVMEHGDGEEAGLRTVTAVYRGTYMEGPPMGQKTAREGWMLLGAVVEGGPRGSVFVRLAGPEGTVSAAEPAWREMLGTGPALGAVGVASEGELLFELYEEAAQSPARQARFLRALGGEGAFRLGEDFCGTGAVSIAWARMGEGFGAEGVDRDGAALARMTRRASEAGVGERARAVEGDVLEAGGPADVIAALNFSVGYFHERSDLLSYLRRARGRLGAGGVFVCDVYGGEDQFVRGVSDLELRGGVRYEWEQREADPLTARVVNAMHFELEGGRRIEDAFVYEWRLWSPAELRDAMLEAGFGRVDYYDRLGDAELEDGSVLVRPASGDELDENFVVYAAAGVAGGP